MISAPASGQGKTTVTAALAAYHRKQGRKVRVFKTGPDFLDPMILEHASGSPVLQLDLWMGGEAHCRQLLSDAARDADLILIEGVMGLYDGERSSADLADLFGIPLLVVIDGSAMAQTFGALAHGLASYRPGTRVAGVFANRVAGPRHCEMLRESLPAGLPLLGWLPRDADFALPERHLGLVQASEVHDIDRRIDRACTALSDVGDLAVSDVDLSAPAREPGKALLNGVRIGIAKDKAFAFLYKANIDVLTELGAEPVYFSPLDDEYLPNVDALYFPGGYPELYLQQLSANESMLEAVRRFHRQGLAILAECGGMLYMLDEVVDKDGNSAAMAGILPGSATQQNSLANIGMQTVNLAEGELRGHTFHYSTLDSQADAAVVSTDARSGGAGEAFYRLKGLTASFMHLYFPSNPEAVARLLVSC